MSNSLALVERMLRASTVSRYSFGSLTGELLVAAFMCIILFFVS